MDFDPGLPAQQHRLRRRCGPGWEASRSSDRTSYRIPGESTGDRHTTEKCDGGGIPLAVLPNSPGTMLPRYVGGVRPTSPGFSTFDIKPTMDGLKYASVKVPTVKGETRVEWRLASDGKGYTLLATIPVNSIANVYLPKQGRQDVSVHEGDALVWQAGKFSRATQGIEDAINAGPWIKLVVGSGTYRFTAQ